MALECSTGTASAALFEGDRLLKEQVFLDKRRNEQALWAALESIMNFAGRELADVALYAVGRGPGRYTGLRMALTAAEMMAMPGNRRVIAVSSGQALAHQLSRENPERETLAVVGDARREQCWMALFERAPEGVRQLCDWKLFAFDSLPAALPEGVLAVSSEWERLSGIIEQQPCGHVDWIKENRYPTAVAVGEIALRRQCIGEGAEPLDLLYMHPPVERPFLEGYVSVGKAAGIEQESAGGVFEGHSEFER